MSRALVLVVDDNLDSHTICAAYLAHAGFEVAHAYDGSEALAQARARNTALILTDIVMPRMDGVSLLRALRNEPATRDLPVVAWSADLVEWDEARALLAGFDAFLPKPCELSRVREVAERYGGTDPRAMIMT
jgi:two-component system, cell cycle response regulator DivK